jgi:uncharacterized Fe-S cluster protein YjdI
MSVLKKKYAKENLTVIWQPDLCMHSTKCFKGLPEVFNTARNPWINMDGARIEEIIKQVDKCPSGALSYHVDKAEHKKNTLSDRTATVDVSHNGPILINGPIEIKYKGKRELKESKIIALCRCGSSNNKPYCDGTHRKKGFIG